LINDDNKQIGIVTLEEAKKIAEDRGLDLILVNKNQNPIVVKLGNYGNFIYQKEKKERRIKKEHKETKEIIISFREADYDLKRKSEKVKEFLMEGHQVKIKLILRGREREFSDIAENKLNKFLEFIKDKINFKITQPFKKNDNVFMIILGPLK